MTSDEQTPKIQVDTDWKAEAQAEKERLAKQEAEREEQGGSEAPGELPPADFKGLIGLLASQAIMGLGAYTDPKSGGVVIDLVGSKFAIDLLAVIEEKTKGNLDEAETTELGQILAELRSRFVQVADAVAKQQANTAATGPLDPTKGMGKGVIETP